MFIVVMHIKSAFFVRTFNRIIKYRVTKISSISRQDVAVSICPSVVPVVFREEDFQ
jgi:hypothetical protein